MEPNWSIKVLTEHGLRITPQRMAVINAFRELPDHPSADQIIKCVQEHNPGIAAGTVYKILDILVERGIICKVKTDKDLMRYDAVQDRHHHLYSAEGDRVEDYFDDELDRLLESYFRKKMIPGFDVGDIRLQITGDFAGMFTKENSNITKEI